MNEQISLCHNLLEKTKNIIGKMVGKHLLDKANFI